MHRSRFLHPPLPLLLITALLLGACTSTDIVANKKSGYDRTVQHMHLYYRVSDVVAPLTEAADAEFKRRFRGAGVPLSTFEGPYDPSKSALERTYDSRDVVSFEKASRDGATHILVLMEKMTRGIERSDTGSTLSVQRETGGKVYAFDVSLYDTELRERVWRAEVTVSSDKIASESRKAEPFVLKVTSTMLDDGLFE